MTKIISQTGNELTPAVGLPQVSLHQHDGFYFGASQEVGPQPPMMPLKPIFKATVSRRLRSLNTDLEVNRDPLSNTSIHCHIPTFSTLLMKCLKRSCDSWDAYSDSIHTANASTCTKSLLANRGQFFFNPETNLRVWGLDLGHNILASIKNHQYLSVQIEYDCETTWY